MQNLSRFDSCRLSKLLFLLTLAAILSMSPSAAEAQSRNVRITGLADIDFGLVSNLSADRALAQNVCVFVSRQELGYNLRAFGSGSGGRFDLTGAGSTLAYEVQWNEQPGRSSGTILQPHVVLSKLSSSATQQTCNSGPPSSASLIVILRAIALQSALSGSYSGTLTVVVGAE